MDKTIFQSAEALIKGISSTIDEKKDDIVKFIRTLIQTPSLPGEEKAVQEIVALKLNQLNLDVEIIPIKLEAIETHKAFSYDGFSVDRRVNVVGRWKGTNKSPSPHSKNKRCRSLILNGHVDVVSPGKESLWDEPPWLGVVKEGRIYGRGSADMKSGLAAAIFACEVLQKLGCRPCNDVILQSVAGEETGGCGTLTNIVKGYTYNADAAIIMEPTELKIYPVQSGALSFSLKIKGKSIHACMKNRGVIAVEKFFLIYQAVNIFEQQRHFNYNNPIYQDPMNVAPINFGFVKAGDRPSTVPDQLVAEGRYGIFPDESIKKAKQAFEETVKQAALADEWLKNNLPEVEWFKGQFEPGATDMNEPVIETLSSSHEAVLKEKIQFAGATYGSDLRLFTNYANIPTVLYGPGDVKKAHMVNESISIDEILKATKVLALTIFNWCGGEFE
jgi:acetylornithine deacetylase